MISWLLIWLDPWEPVFERGPWLYEQHALSGRRRASSSRDVIGLHELVDETWLHAGRGRPIIRRRLVAGDVVYR